MEAYNPKTNKPFLRVTLKSLVLIIFIYAICISVLTYDVVSYFAAVNPLYSHQSPSYSPFQDVAAPISIRRQGQQGAVEIFSMEGKPANITEPASPGISSQLEYKLIWSNPSIKMDDPFLLDTIRKMLIPPSTKSYRFRNKKLYRPGFNPSAGQVQAVADILKAFGSSGFFLECGANDGEWNSNSLWLEKTLKWQGILLEPDPAIATRLLSQNRKAWVGKFCLSDKPFPRKPKFYIQKSLPRHLGNGLIRSETYKATEGIRVKCVPLYSLLLAMNRTTIHFFSLDVEGNELDILRTVPFDKVIFKVITIEHLVLKEGKVGLRKFMEEKGYIFYRTVVVPNYRSGDSIFIHPSVNLTAEQRGRIGIENSNITRPPR